MCQAPIRPSRIISDTSHALFLIGTLVTVLDMALTTQAIILMLPHQLYRPSFLWRTTHAPLFYGEPTLSEIKSQVRAEQNEINREYKESIKSKLRAMGNGPMVASVDVYKNGDFVKTVSLSGGGTPSSSSSSSVSGLLSGYWPPGTIKMISISNPNGGSNNVVSTYPTSGSYRMHQEIDMSYPPSTPQVLVDVEVEAGDMIQFVVQAQLGTRGLSAPSPVSVTTDLRMHLTDTTITSTGYRDATITIEGGAIEIFCCSE